MATELLARLRARIEAFAKRADDGPILEEEALQEAEQLLKPYHSRSQEEAIPGDMVDVLLIVAIFYWQRYCVLDNPASRSDRDRAVSLFTRLYEHAPDAVPEQFHPLLDTRDDWLAAGIPAESLTWASLADTFLRRFRATGDPGFLRRAIALLTAELKVGSASLPDQLAVRSQLVAAQMDLHRVTGDLASLREAAQLARATVELVPDTSAQRATALSDLASVLLSEWSQTGVAESLKDALQTARDAVATSVSTDPNRPAYLSNLATILRNQWLQSGSPAALDEAISNLLAATAAAPAGGDGKEAYLSNLAVTLLARYESAGSLVDLDEAIEASRSAVAATPAGHPDLPARVSNLGIALLARYKSAGDGTDLDEAIRASRSAVEASPDGHPRRAAMLSNLGAAFLDRFEGTGSLVDLDEAIEASRLAVAATPAGHPDLPARMSNLGIALFDRFEGTGSLVDLDEAIKASRSAVEASPDGHPRRAAMLSNLGAALRTRFARGGASPDLDEAIAVSWSAVAATPPDQPDLPGRRSNLGAALRSRFLRTGAIVDLDAAIEVGREAVGSTPAGHPDRPGRLSNLGNALQARWADTGSVADLDAAIEVGREAVGSTPAGHPDRPGRLSNLGNALQARWADTGSVADLDAAIEVGREAVRTAPSEHLNYAAYLFNLGTAVQARLHVTQAAEDWLEALSAFTEAAELSSTAPSIRIFAARRAAELAHMHQPNLAASLLETAVRLLPEVAPRLLERDDQQHALEGMSGLASDAAALALADTSIPFVERPARALRLLEAGRAVLLSQALDSRNDLTDLRRQNGQLAARFAELRDELDQFGQPASDSVPNLVRTDSALPFESTTPHLLKDRRETARRLTEVLAEIRSLPGFSNFGLPPDIGELLQLAEPGPIVAFSISAYRSDALLLTPSGIRSVELPELSSSRLNEQVSAFQLALAEATHLASAMQRGQAQAKLSEILEWLWDAAAGPVLDALGYRDQPLPGVPWPRVWWAPGGLLNLLPLHAAGYHDDNSRRTVMDRVVSSYTPTLRALRHARQQALQATDVESALIVSMPTTPGLPGGELPGARVEAEMLAARLPESVSLVEPDTRTRLNSEQHLNPEDVLASLPTRANVLAHLPGHGIVHFSCHGFSDPVDSSRSMLLLHDYESAPLTVSSLTSVNLQSAGIAYLAACSTGQVGSAELADEAIHLTTAFQIAGFPHVIGTLWQIGDRSAAEVAQTFYDHLAAEPGRVVTTRSALALHQTVRAMRDKYPKVPFIWAAYLHSGA